MSAATILSAAGFALVVDTLVFSAAAAQEVSQTSTVGSGLELCQSAVELLQGDQEPTTITNAVVCVNIVKGVTAVMALNCWSVKMGFSPAPFFSSSPPPNNNAAVLAFLDWAKNTPEEIDATFEEGIMVAVSEAYPCKS